MDRTRLDASLTEMTTAQAEYDSALKNLAEATRAAARSADATTAVQLEAATAELAQARLQVEAARVSLDDIRVDELATFELSDQFLGAISGNQVLGLFPVGVEAKLESGRLRVRIWPDAISTSTHDPRLTEEELAAGKEYWRAAAAATDEATSRGAWRVFADVVGPTRAAWIAEVLTPINRDALAPGVDPVFPIVAMDDEAAPSVPRASVLPDRWIAIGTRDFVKVVEHLGAPIPLDLAVGLDTTPSETAALTNREGEPIQLPPRMRWMTDFAMAVQVGMALDIPLAAEVDRLDELLIVGVRVTQTPAQNATTLADLFTGHRFSRGFAFVPQDAPTNNSVAGGSGLPSRSARIDTAFDVERRPRAFTADLRSNGMAAAHAFGIPADAFARMPESGATTAVATEPRGFEPESASAMQAVLWPLTMGAALEDLLLLPPARTDKIRHYFIENVHAAGPVPALRVGRQPYGILPVTTIDGFTPAPEEGIDQGLIPLMRAARTWFLMKRESPVYEGSPEEALRHLGRSTHLFAETTLQNPNSSVANRWSTLAGTLAVASSNSIPNTWRNSRITGMIEGVPQPVERPIVDGDTPATIASLATANPNAILDMPQPATVLGRMVRQAALLEWSRFARRAVEACVDLPSNDDLESNAFASGSEIYIRLLVQAMTEAIVTPDTPPVVGSPTRITRSSLRRPGDDEPPDIPEPEPDPDRPHREPPPPPGEPEVTLVERQKIRALVGSLPQPLATCPGAPRLASFRAALLRLSRFPPAQLEAEMFRVLDICNHRVDAWYTSVATRRLSTLRAANPDGIVIGGWGCLQDVRRTDPADPLQRAEFIHTPSLDQAAAAAVLRSAARRAHRGGSNHADIDLSSRRVRLARWILDGVRNGRSLGDLLGARFERALKGTPAEGKLGELRAAFPSFNSRSVLDGLKLQTELSPPDDADVARAVSTLDAALDAVADALTAEAVYQIVQGNPVGALVNVDAIAEGAPPPELRVTETPASGVRLTQRVAVILPQSATAPGWTGRVTPRSSAEPLLDAWCGLVLGPPDRIVVTVEDATGASVAVLVSSLALSAIDVVFGGRNHGSELGEFVVRAALAVRSDLVAPQVRADRAWRDLIGLCAAAARVITAAEPLRPESFEPPTAMIAAQATEDFGDLPARVATAASTLIAVRDDLLARTDVAAAVVNAALFDIRVPGVLIGAVPTTAQQDALLAAVEARLAGAAIGTPRDRLRALFGGDLPGVVGFTARDPDSLTTAGSPAPSSLLRGDALAPMAWLDASGRTHARVAALAEVLLRNDVRGEAPSGSIAIAQVPWRDGDRWIATAFTSASTQPPVGRLSVFMHAPAGFVAGAPMGGLLIDAWTETIPAATRDTAMALRFNNASTRAPQVILLAVNPNPAQAWTTDTLADILRQTLTLTRIRMQPPTEFSRGGLLPFAFLGQRAGSTGLSFSV